MTMNELEIIEHRQMEGLSAFINTVDYRTSHVHPEWELIWILDEPLSVACGQRRFEVQPGQMVLFSPNEPHEFHKVDKSSTFVCLQISADILPIGKQLEVEERLPHEYMTENEFQQLKNKTAAVMMAYLICEENYALYCLGESCLILYQLLSSLPTHVLTPEESASIDRRNARLKRLIRFVDENYMHKIRLSDFAEAEGCSMSHLSHFIKSAMNQTFQEYVNSVRFNRACELIAAGERRMLDVCMESGFSDYRYFSRTFHERYDMSPEEYSRNASRCQLESAVVHRSIHSMERFYSREDSLEILEKYL